jgi:hypothetical protein
MYEVWVSEDGHLSRVARFRLVVDALRFVDTHRAERSYAIRQPDGAWYRDADGHAIFGRRSQGADHAGATDAVDVSSDAIPRAISEEEITQPLTAGAAMRRTATGPIVIPPRRHGDDEITDVSWPPVRFVEPAGADDFGFERTPR